MRRVKFARVLAVGTVLLGSSVACSGDDSSADDSQPASLERIEYANVDVPEDRAADAVGSALGSIDPCALIDPSGTGVKHLSTGSDVEALSPHACEVSNGVVRVSARIGAAFSTEDRYNAGLESIGGAKAYVVVPTGDPMLCQVALPVDFTHSIMFVGSYSFADNRDACDNAKAFARAAAKRLEQPDSVAHAKGPANQTACDILRPAVDLNDETELRSGSDFEQGIDQCGVWENVDEGGLQPAAPNVELSIEYSDPAFLDYYKKAGTVHGRQLRAHDCTLAWNERKVPGSIATDQVVRFEIDAQSCNKAKRLTADITKIIDQGRVAKPADPQRPVLYAPGEPDAPAAGACIDVMDSAESKCHPYEKTDAPTDGKETIEAANADPNVNCAIAAEAVEEHFGSNLRPVTAQRGIGQLDTPARMCGFVEESHAAQVWVGVSEGSMSESAGSEIGGQPAHDETTASAGERTISVALGEEDEPGYLYGEVLVRPAREDGDFDDSPVDEAPLQKLDEAMTDIVDDHFNAGKSLNSMRSGDR